MEQQIPAREAPQLVAMTKALGGYWSRIKCVQAKISGCSQTFFWADSLGTDKVLG
jgi:hypothetical protein